ncbi:MAG: hypothetical protein KJ960_04005 [Gammaproteobacteria bacterium]|nr:hypothetical protein [Gammaproteobacteria bacterium]
MYNSYTAMQRQKMEQAIRAHQTAQQTKAQVKQERVPSSLYHLRVLREWCDAQPPAMRTVGLPLETICAAAFANEARSPAPRLAAQALRQLGWKQRRDYRKAAGGRRYWFAPETN